MNPDGADWDDDDQPGLIAWQRVQLENEILSALRAPSAPGDRIETEFQRKEQELIMLFARLTVLDAMELHRRLRLDLATDPIATSFGRLIAERDSWLFLPELVVGRSCVLRASLQLATDVSRFGPAYLGATDVRRPYKRQLS